MVLDELLDELEKTDLQYALLDSFIRVFAGEAKRLWKRLWRWREIKCCKDDIEKTTKLFLLAFTKRVE